jgi:hypothetical protein
VAAHARNAESIKLCLRHGVQIIYHANLADEEARDLLEAHRHEVFVAPTVGWTVGMLERGAEFGRPTTSPGTSDGDRASDPAADLPDPACDAARSTVEQPELDREEHEQHGLEPFVKLLGSHPNNPGGDEVRRRLMMKMPSWASSGRAIWRICCWSVASAGDVSILQNRDRLLAIARWRVHKAVIDERRSVLDVSRLIALRELRLC